MMPRRKKYTIFIIPSDQSKQRSFEMSRRTFILMILAVLVVLSGFIVSLSYFAPRAVQYGEMSGEVNRLASDRAQLMQLIEDYRKMKAMNQYIRKIMGLHLVKWEDDSTALELPDSLQELTPMSESQIVVLDNIPNTIPVHGLVSQEFRMDQAFEEDNHPGIDIATRSGSEVTAAAGGLVVFSGWMDHYGNTVIIDHRSGYYTMYGHNSRNVVTARQWVERRQLIALSGNTGVSTGPHLHFEIWKDGTPQNPTDYIAEYNYQ